MTQDELDALPDVSDVFGAEEKIIDGRRVIIPVHIPGPALFQGPEDGAVQDRFGIWWIIGWHEGVRVKRASSFGEHWPREN